MLQCCAAGGTARLIESRLRRLSGRAVVQARERREVVRRFRNKENTEEIARAFGVSAHAVKRAGRMAGVTREVGKGRVRQSEWLADAMLDEEFRDERRESRGVGIAKVSPLHPQTHQEVRRLRNEKGLARYHIAALLRMPYSEIEKALDGEQK